VIGHVVEAMRRGHNPGADRSARQYNGRDLTVESPESPSPRHWVESAAPLVAAGMRMLSQGKVRSAHRLGSVVALVEAVTVLAIFGAPRIPSWRRQTPRRDADGAPMRRLSSH